MNISAQLRILEITLQFARHYVMRARHLMMQAVPHCNSLGRQLSKKKRKEKRGLSSPCEKMF